MLVFELYINNYYTWLWIMESLVANLCIINLLILAKPVTTFTVICKFPLLTNLKFSQNICIHRIYLFVRKQHSILPEFWFLLLTHYARRYMPNGIILAHNSLCACVKQVLIGWKLIFGYKVQGQRIHRTVERFSTNHRIHDVSQWLIGWKSFHCAMYLLLLDLVSKNQLSTNQNLFNAYTNLRNDCWTCIIPLDMYRLATVLWNEEPTNIMWFVTVS